MFRNYNGTGGEFGDTYVRSTSADQGRLAVYGARRSGDGAITVVVVNKSTQPLTSTLTLGGDVQPSGSAAAYQWADGSIARIADLTVFGSAIAATYPARSITTIVVPQISKGPAPAPAPPPGDGATTAQPPAPAQGGSTPTVTTKPPAALTAKGLLAAAHLAKKVRSSTKGAVRLGYFTCPPVCGTVKLTGPGSAKLRVKASKKVPVVLTLPKSVRRSLARKGSLRVTLTIAFGSLKARQKLTVLAPKRRSG